MVTNTKSSKVFSFECVFQFLNRTELKTATWSVSPKWVTPMDTAIANTLTPFLRPINTTILHHSRPHHLPWPIPPCSLSLTPSSTPPSAPSPPKPRASAASPSAASTVPFTASHRSQVHQFITFFPNPLLFIHSSVGLTYFSIANRWWTGVAAWGVSRERTFVDCVWGVGHHSSLLVPERVVSQDHRWSWPED